MLAIQKAETDLQAKTNKHQQLVADRDSKAANLHKVEETKKQHDAIRQATLEKDTVPAAVAAH